MKYWQLTGMLAAAVTVAVATMAAAEESESAAAVDQEQASFYALARAAKEYDASIAAAGALLSAEKESVSQALSNMLPQLSLSTENTWNRQRFSPEASNTINDSQQVLQLSQPIINLRVLYEYRGAKSAAAARIESYRETEQQLFLEVVAARLSLHIALDRLNLLRKREKNIEEQLKITRLRELGGIGTYLDVALVEAELEGVRADLQSAHSERQTAQNVLARLTGVTVRALPEIRADFRFLPPPPLTVVVEKIRINNPALAAARRQTEEFQYLKKAATAALFFPVINLVAERNWQTSGTTTSSAGFNMVFSLYEGGRVMSQNRQLQYQHMAAQHSLIDINRQLSESADSLHSAAVAAVRRSRSLRAAIRARRISLEKNQIAWREGARLASDVLTAEEELFDAELQLRNLIYNYLTSLAQLQVLSADMDDDYFRHLDSFFE